MNTVPKNRRKIQFLEDISLEIIEKLCPRNKFIGGRIGYGKATLFYWLLVKKILNWDYRTIGEEAGISHTSLVRANQRFLEEKAYEKFFLHLVKSAYKNGLIQGKYAAIDSSFVKTFSGKRELGSEGVNGKKKACGFKLHLLIDCQTEMPIALTISNGIGHDSTYAIPLLKKARYWLKKVGYVIADKGYDSGDIVTYIWKTLKAKASIPMRKKSRLAKGKKNRYGNLLNWQLKAKGRSVKKSIYNKRTAVERVFSHLKRIYHLGKEETRGILNFAKNVYLSLISYMLKKFWIEGITL